MSTHFETLKALLAARRRQNVDGVGKCLHDEITWNNSGRLRAPIQAKAAMRDVLRRVARIWCTPYQFFVYFQELGKHGAFTFRAGRQRGRSM